MPEEIAIQPRAQGERVFVPYGNIRAQRGALGELADLFKVGVKTTETLTDIAAREEAARLEGRLIDPTITDEALDRMADEATWNLTKVKIANRRGQIQFDRERQRIEESLRNTTDPADVRAGLRAYKQEQLAKTPDAAQQAGFMEAFAPFAIQRIERAHAERGAHLQAEDDALVGAAFKGSLENYPEEFGLLFREFYVENATFGDTKRLLGRVIDSAVSYAQEDPENYDVAISSLEQMLAAGVIDDSEERRAVTTARNQLLSAKGRADDKALDTAQKLNEIEHGKAIAALVEASRKGEPITEQHIDAILRTGKPEDQFKAMTAIDNFLNRDVRDFAGVSASRADMNAWSTAVRQGRLEVVDIMNLHGGGAIDSAQQDELLKLHETMRSKNNPVLTDEAKLELRALRDQLKLDQIEMLVSEHAVAVNAEMYAAFERWLAGLPPHLSRPENSSQLAAMAREKRRELADSAEKTREMIESGTLSMERFREILDANFTSHPHLGDADDLFNGYVR